MHKATPAAINGIRRQAEKLNRAAGFMEDPPYHTQAGVPSTHPDSGVYDASGQAPKVKTPTPSRTTIGKPFALK